jgi:hypothetical protein
MIPQVASATGGAGAGLIINLDTFEEFVIITSMTKYMNFVMQRMWHGYGDQGDRKGGSGPEAK